MNLNLTDHEATSFCFKTHLDFLPDSNKFIIITKYKKLETNLYNKKWSCINEIDDINITAEDIIKTLHESILQNTKKPKIKKDEFKRKTR